MSNISFVIWAMEFQEKMLLRFADLYLLKLCSGFFFAFQWSPNLPSILASGCLDGKALLWDVRKARNCLMSFDMGNIQARTTI